MKRILIVGKDSFIGTSLENYLRKDNFKYSVSTIPSIDDAWRKHSFTGYDTLLHVAGIADVSSKKYNDRMYFKTNRDLAVETAVKAKESGIRQFIFMSSIMIYGDEANFGKDKIIGIDTEYSPKNSYGRSKLDADLKIQEMADESFKSAIIRSPAVYGPGSKGNFQRLISIAEHIPIFPNIKSLKSMIYIDNLCEFIKLIIDNQSDGVFFPQNKEYVSVYKTVRTIKKIKGKKAWYPKIFNTLISFLVNRSGLFKKIFGSRVYDKSLSDSFDFRYAVYDFESSIKKILKVNV